MPEAVLIAMLRADVIPGVHGLVLGPVQLQYTLSEGKETGRVPGCELAQVAVLLVVKDEG